jgi:aromatic-L-amino-acid decarboxylase
VPRREVADMKQLPPFHSPLHTYDKNETDVLLSYVRTRLEPDETPLDFPGNRADIEKALAGLISAQGNSVEKVLGIYENAIAPTVLSADSPRFLSFIPAAPSKSALLFDTIVSCASLQGMSWLEAAGVIVAENQVLRFIADLAGMPASTGGTFVSGGSAANLSALTVARDWGREKTGQREVRVAMSAQAHSSIASTLHILDIDALILDTEDDRVTEASLRRTLERDTDPRPVIAVVVTSGTTNAGIVDDIAGVARVTQERELWLHVDGAYGGAGLLSPLVRDKYNGLEFADSFITDPHKWWFAPFDCAALLYRNPQLARRVHTQDASYLDVLHEGLADDEINPTDVAYHLTRRARGLPLWYSLAVHGVDAYRDAVSASIQLAHETAEYIKTLDYIELIREPELSVVLWRRKGWAHADYEKLQDKLLADQVAFVTPTKWKGETVGRFAFLHPETTLDVVKDIFDQCR